MTYKLVGVDGCKKQWLAVAQDEAGYVSAFICPTPEDVLENSSNSDVIAVDVPIGLMTAGRRQCDMAARVLLGSPRCNSVFYTPIRAVFDAKTRHEASDTGRQLDGHGVSCQSWAIFPYIKSWDALMRQSDIARGKVYEVHPEVCFYQMNSCSPMLYSKKKQAGLAERRRLLDGEFGESVIKRALASLEGKNFALDDFYDACVALWCAQRIASKCAISLPAVPPTDRYGLVMAIYY